MAVGHFRGIPIERTLNGPNRGTTYDPLNFTHGRTLFI